MTKTPPKSEPNPDDDENIPLFDSTKAVNDLTAQIKELGEGLVGSQVLLESIRRANLPSSVASELVREVYMQLDTRAKASLVQEGLFPSDQGNRLMWSIIIGAFAIVFVGCFLVLGTVILLRWREKDDASLLQMMMTMFSACVAFLGGLFAQAPGSQTGATKLPQFNTKTHQSTEKQ